MKNYQLQMRQKLTNVLQIFMPILFISIVMFLREAIVLGSAVWANQDIQLPVPFFYNLPMKPLSTLGLLFNVTDCLEWYQFSFNTSTATQEDIEYFGMNQGFPMHSPQSSGMLRKDMMQQITCHEFNRSVPYFEYDDQKESSMNHKLKEKLYDMQGEYVDMQKKYVNVEGLYNVPDGMIEV